MDYSTNKITTNTLISLLDEHFPEYKKRVVHGKDLHSKDIESLLSEINDYNVTTKQLIHAIHTLKPHADIINDEYRYTVKMDSPFLKERKHDKMYQVGIGRLLLDITHLEFRKRIEHSINMINFLDKWHQVSSK